MTGPQAGWQRARVSGAMAAMLFAVFAALTAAAVIHPGPFVAEQWWADLVSAHRTGALTSAARVFDALGRFPWSLLIVGLATLVVWRARIAAGVVTLLTGEAVSWTISTVTKIAVGRPRPPGGLIAPISSSFPSGHTAFATVTAVLLVGLLCRRERRRAWAVLAAVFAIGMAWSRTYLMVHWLGDVTGGLALGAAVGLGALALRTWWLERAGEATDIGREDPVCP
jgi:membrane-associated phospholipid phosphatase